MNVKRVCPKKHPRPSLVPVYAEDAMLTMWGMIIVGTICDIRYDELDYKWKGVLL